MSILNNSQEKIKHRDPDYFQQPSISSQLNYYDNYGGSIENDDEFFEEFGRESEEKVIVDPNYIPFEVHFKTSIFCYY